MSRVRVIVVGIVLLLAAYVGSYLALLDPIEVGDGGLYRWSSCRVPAYRAGSDFADAVFRPAAWVDRQVRPDYWAWREEVWESPAGVAKPATCRNDWAAQRS